MDAGLIIDVDEKKRLVVGLDLPTVKEAERIVSILSDTVSFYKIGYHLSFSGGLELARDLISDGKSVFLDMKLFDIGSSVTAAIEHIANMGVAMLTVHAYPQTMRSAVSVVRDTGICLLAVTVLTSMDDFDLRESGYEKDISDMVRMRAVQARDIGMGGIVCSPQEVRMVREIVGHNMVIVTPGIRMLGSATDGQKRFATPETALKYGASHIVVSRPIVRAADPVSAAQEFQRAISLIS
ncbi:orotidine-5'-phosphate decarboxylase [Candidatus Liberibacter asiaticus]|uniref:Orotidine 5'-phosphate decarboxylase n=2 Tax=Liberibacter asiaticus TaxID=34021 RepID=C6XEX4_LIBAP|nr:orotidine-5'-phosphate decarboxylase [Candidatus Liberibacter asiaticus]ACT56926.1 orotidine 5'-phosphate decarboxylase [Candidatus Liberibacter asiaticus str. psy62]AGH16690.1 orotidine 5'-phosphate decarboxylase [Candidatus Liberibacter asiaticus str. gxpsy]ALK07068.1 orotidine-5'-phosphate decarboxylase [Candidatus Liberibacter asiaticus]ASK53250.1 orotidine 5'-phosphate decarboxylase [Candidatus Liberibacter asiaticus]AWL13865.1 orotidine-5'-phosphate decarboxylase [Candidatus Liberibac